MDYTYTFRLRNTECGSKIFGDCEVCKKPVVETFNLQKFKNKYFKELGRIGTIEVYSVYGHRNCLINLTEK